MFVCLSLRFFEHFIWHWIDFNDNSLIIRGMLSNTTTIYSHTRDKVQLDTYSLKTTPLSDLTRTLLLSSNWDFIHCFKYALIKQYFAQTTIILLLVCRLRLVVVHHHLVVNIIRHAHAPKTLSLCKYSSTHHLKLNLTSQHIISSIARRRFRKLLDFW